MRYHIGSDARQMGKRLRIDSSPAEIAEAVLYILQVIEEAKETTDVLRRIRNAIDKRLDLGHW